MLRYLARRLLAAAFVLVGVSFSVFLMLYLIPGDPIAIMFTQGQGVISPGELERIRHLYGLDKPFIVQYGRYIWHVLHGDFGWSIFFSRPALEVFREQLPATISLAAFGMLAAAVFGLSVGTLAAVLQNSWLDQVSMLLAIGGVSVPSFWLGQMLIIGFAVTLHLLPAQGTGGLDRLVLPAAALGFEAAALIARITRSSMLEVLRSEYVRTARSKGLSEYVVVVRHALRNTLVAVLTVLALQFGNMLAGTVVIEKVFARQGIGSVLVDAIFDKDYLMVQTIILFVAVVYTMLNLIVDLLYAVLDPRIRIAA